MTIIFIRKTTDALTLLLEIDLFVQYFSIKILAITIVNTDKASTTNTIANAARATQKAVPNIDVV
jgi:hypothetical protein